MTDLHTDRNRILCSTGALIGKPNGRDFTLLAGCVDRLNCDGFEFMMYDTWYDKHQELCRTVDSLQISVPTFHIEKSVGEHISRNEPGDTEQALSLFEINCRLAKIFGSKLLVLHLWNGLHSDKNIAHNIEVYPYLREISDRYGLLLTVENVVCNHADPMTHMLSLLDAYPDIAFTFDTKMAAFHDQLPLLYSEDCRHLFPHLRHFHINDYGGGYLDWSNLRTLPIGAGHIAFSPLFDILKANSYRGDFTVEATAFDEYGTIHFDILNESFDAMRRLLAQTKPAQ